LHSVVGDQDSRDFRLDVVPRTNGKFFVSAEDFARANSFLPPGGERVDRFRLRPGAKVLHNNHEQTGRSEQRPDPFGQYTTDALALPPGLESVPLITFVDVADGRPTGGFTWAIREVESQGFETAFPSVSKKEI
jgi:hypothetical protein